MLIPIWKSDQMRAKGLGLRPQPFFEREEKAVKKGVADV